MKIPHKIRIKARISYEVLFATEVKSDPKCLGYCDPNTRQIILKSDQSETEMLKTFLHETLHAIEYEYTDGIPHKFIEALEEGIFKVLSLNKFIPR
jgi:hypothetical protein